MPTALSGSQCQTPMSMGVPLWGLSQPVAGTGTAPCTISDCGDTVSAALRAGKAARRQALATLEQCNIKQDQRPLFLQPDEPSKGLRLLNSRKLVIEYSIYVTQMLGI